MITLNFMDKEEIEEKDVFNRNNSHNYSELTSSFNDCNCMSYVFGAYEWMIPFDIDIGIEDTTDILEELGIDYDEDLCAAIDNALDCLTFEHPLLIKLAIERMLKAFPDLRRIKNFNELKDDEYGIVYAAGGGDFHFGKYENGIYSHKMGNLSVKEVKTEDDIFGHRYDSKRFRFAMKKGVVRYEC